MVIPNGALHRSNGLKILIMDDNVLYQVNIRGAYAWGHLKICLLMLLMD